MSKGLDLGGIMVSLSCGGNIKVVEVYREELGGWYSLVFMFFDFVFF